MFTLFFKKIHSSLGYFKNLAELIIIKLSLIMVEVMYKVFVYLRRNIEI